MPDSDLFASTFRVHFGLAVTDLNASVVFYETLLGASPVKIREGYAKFEPSDPSINLSLNVVNKSHPAHPDEHYGIQVKSQQAVWDAKARLEAAGLRTRTEENTACCYAVQDKIWVSDPDGRAWEIFVVLEEDSPIRKEATSTCCAGEGQASNCCG